MAHCIRCCIGSIYALNAFKLIQHQIGGIQGGELGVGPLKDLVEEKRVALGISHPIRLVVLPRHHHLFAENLFLSCFGNTIFPGSPGIAIPERHNLNEREIKYSILEQVCRLKTNQSFLSEIAGMIAGIATALLLLPALPLTAWIVGALAGRVAQIAVSRFLENKSIALIKQHASPEQIESGLMMYRRMNQRIINDVIRPIDQFAMFSGVSWMISTFIISRNERMAAKLEDAVNRPAPGAV